MAVTEFSGLDHASFAKIDIEHARFNALKTVNDTRESRFSVSAVGGLFVTSDAHRSASYCARVIGLTEATLGDLNAALALTDGAIRVDVDAREPTLSSALESLGFRRSAQVTWLGVEPAPRALEHPVARWGPEHVDRVLPFFDAFDAVPVDRDTWSRRRQHLCTDTFRTFGVEVDGADAAMATMWVHDDVAILGSAVTLAPFQQRGFHRALLDARVSDAHTLGLRWIVTDVEPDTTSHRNTLRAGFTQFLVQSVWERA